MKENEKKNGKEKKTNRIINKCKQNAKRQQAAFCVYYWTSAWHVPARSLLPVGQQRTHAPKNTGRARERGRDYRNKYLFSLRVRIYICGVLRLCLCMYMCVTHKKYQKVKELQQLWLWALISGAYHPPNVISSIQTILMTAHIHTHMAYGAIRYDSLIIQQ